MRGAGALPGRGSLQMKSAGPLPGRGELSCHHRGWRADLPGEAFPGSPERHRRRRRCHSPSAGPHMRHIWGPLRSRRRRWRPKPEWPPGRGRRPIRAPPGARRIEGSGRRLGRASPRNWGRWTNTSWVCRRHRNKGTPNHAGTTQPVPEWFTSHRTVYTNMRGGRPGGQRGRCSPSQST